MHCFIVCGLCHHLSFSLGAFCMLVLPNSCSQANPFQRANLHSFNVFPAYAAMPVDCTMFTTLLAAAPMLRNACSAGNRLPLGM